MRIALISRHFTPEVSGAVRRTTGIVRALEAAGHEVVVIAPSTLDEAVGAFVTDSSKDKGRFGPLSQMINGLYDYAHIPDPEIGWVKRQIDATKSSAEGCDLVITTSPPESIHLAGYIVKTTMDIAWLADFRDPWFGGLHRPVRRVFPRPQIERRLACRWLAHADAVSVVDPIIQGELRALGVKAPIYMANDDPLPTVEPRDLGGGLHLVYTGQFSKSTPERRIEPLLDFVEKAAERHPELSVHIAGSLTPQENSAVLASQVSQLIHLHGPVTLEEALSLQQAATALLITEGASAKYPGGKLREYAKAYKPVLAVGRGAWRSACPGNEMSELEALDQIVAGNVDAFIPQAATGPGSTAIADIVGEIVAR